MIFYLEKLTVLAALFFLWRQAKPRGWVMPSLILVFALIEAYFAIDFLLLRILPSPPS